jgi:hypothetical protein
MEVLEMVVSRISMQGEDIIGHTNAKTQCHLHTL